MSEKKKRESKPKKGAHLVEKFVAIANETGLNVKEQTGFFKITGSAKGRVVYVAKRGARVDLSGFSLDHPAVTKISEEDAKRFHLGKVRGQFNYDDTSDDALLKVFELSIGLLVQTSNTDAAAA